MNMEMMFAVLFGGAISVFVRYVLPGSTYYGSAVLGALGSAVSAVVWAALTWAGLAFDGGWIWVAAILAGPLAALAFALLVPGRRAAADEALFQQLTRG